MPARDAIRAGFRLSRDPAPQHAMKIPNRTKHPHETRRAMTLVELVVVVAILAVAGGIVVLRSDSVLNGAGSEAGALALATRASLANIAGAITGAPGQPGFRQDLGELPEHLADLFRRPAQLPSGQAVDGWDPVHARGWNGPYVIRPSGYYHVLPARGFSADYGADDDPATLDAWGNPVVLQLPPDPSLQERFGYARLVSAGPDGVIATDPADKDPDLTERTQVGDDVVLYLYRSNGP